MRNLLIALMACAILAMTAMDATAQRGRGGFGNNNGGGRGEAAPAGTPAQLPQAPGDFGAPTQTLPTAPPNFGAATTPAPAAAAPAGGNPAAAAPQAAAPPKSGPAPKQTLVRVVDGLISVQATSVPLVQLIKQLDNAMGTNSRIKKELESRAISVRFDDLPYDAAVRKIFQGVALDYIVVPGEGLIVTAQSGVTSVATPTPSPTGGTVAPPTPTTPGGAPPIFNTESGPPFAGNPANPPVPAGVLPGIDPFGGPPAVVPAAPAPGGGPAPPATPPPATVDFNGPTSAPLPSFGAPAGGGGGGLGGGGLIPFGAPLQ